MKLTTFIRSRRLLIFSFVLCILLPVNFVSFQQRSATTHARAGVHATTGTKDTDGKSYQKNVYTVDYDGTVVKLDGLTGVPLWRFALPTDMGWPSGELQVHNETLYVTYSNLLIALNANTGSERWRLNFDEQTRLKQILLGERTIYLHLQVETETQVVDSYKALKDNGKELWYVTGFKPSIVAFLLHDTIYWNVGKGATALYAFDVQTAKIRWTLTGQSLPYAGTLIAHHGMLYGTFANTLFALNEADGTVLWQQKSTNEQLWWNEARVDHNQLIASEIFWDCFHQPKVCADSLHTVALDRDNGTIKWESVPGYGIGTYYVFSSTLFVAGQHVLAEHPTANAKYIAALDRTTGAVQWETPTCDSGTCSTAWNGVKNNTFYRLQYDYAPEPLAVLQAFNIDTGRLQTYRTKMLVNGNFKATEANGLLYTRGQKGGGDPDAPTYVIQAMQLSDATLKWTYEMRATAPDDVYLVSSPVVAP